MSISGRGPRPRDCSLYLTAVLGPWTGIGLWPVSHMAGGEWRQLWEALSIFTAAPHHSLPSKLCLLSDQWRHNKYNMLESSQNHSHPTQTPPRSMEKLSSPKPVPGTKKTGDRCYVTHEFQVAVSTVDNRMAREAVPTYCLFVSLLPFSSYLDHFCLIRSLTQCYPKCMCCLHRKLRNWTSRPGVCEVLLYASVGVEQKFCKL